MPGESPEAEDRGAWRATVHGVMKSLARLSDWVCTSVQALVRVHTHTHALETRKLGYEPTGRVDEG